MQRAARASLWYADTRAALHAACRPQFGRELLPLTETAYYIHNFKGTRPGARPAGARVCCSAMRLTCLLARGDNALVAPYRASFNAART